MLIGYMRVSKTDGSQTTDLQRDALIAASVNPAHLYEDLMLRSRSEYLKLSVGAARSMDE